MKKILYIITQSELGGAQRYLLDLATNLDKNQYEVHIAFGGNGEVFGPLEGQKIASHGLKHLIRSISPISDIKAYFEIKKLISDIKPDIVHLNSSKAGVLGSMAIKKLKVPKTIYTAHGFVFNEPMNPIKKWIYKRAEIGTSKRVHNIISVSEYDKLSGIKAGIAKDKLVTIHNGVNPNMSFLSREEARTKLNIQSDKPVIGCVANLYNTKGLDILIKAMTKVDAKLIIIGEGNLRPILDEQIKKLGLDNQITLAGAIPDASKYLKAFDLFVLPSRKEGLPYAILEAQAAQIMITSTKTGGIPEIIKNNINGYLAEPENINDLADKINLGLQKPLPSKLDSEFKLDEMIRKTIEVYSK